MLHYRLAPALRAYLLLSLAPLALSASAQAQGTSPGVPVTNSQLGPASSAQIGLCSPEWSRVGAGLNNTARAQVVFDDGSGPALYVGGSFRNAGGLPANRIARWDGTLWTALGTGIPASGTNVSVMTLEVYDDGSGPALYAGGNFAEATGAPGNGVAKWDGVAWSPLGTGLDGEVRSLCVFDDGTGDALYAAGSFTTAGGIQAPRMARWDGSTWSSVGGGMNSTVHALEVFDDGTGAELYAGGNFTTSGGTSTSRVAKWDGTTWRKLISGISNTVHSLQVYDDGAGDALYAGGGFSFAGGVSAKGIARWDGSTWTALEDGVGAGFVYALGVLDEGGGAELYLGGSFSSFQGPGNNIARWDGTNLVGHGDGIQGGIFTLGTFDDGTGPALYSGGALEIGSGHFVKWECSTVDSGVAYCFGDGTGAVCPCGAAGNSGEGCANSGGSGATLQGMGSASLSSDSFLLQVSGAAPLTTSGLILRGANQLNGGNGNPAGDGLLCTGGQTARSHVQATSGGSATFTDFAGVPFGAASYGAGLPTNYQFWYRDTGGTCSGSKFNFSNAWTVTWTP